MSRLDVERACRVIRAALLSNGWTLHRERVASTGTRYWRLVHPVRPSLGVRIADHRGRVARGIRFQSVTSEAAMWQLVMRLRGAQSLRRRSVRNKWGQNGVPHV